MALWRSPSHTSRGSSCLRTHGCGTTFASSRALPILLMRKTKPTSSNTEVAMMIVVKHASFPGLRTRMRPSTGSIVDPPSSPPSFGAAARPSGGWGSRGASTTSATPAGALSVSPQMWQ